MTIEAKVEELNRRWEKVLAASEKAVNAHPETYRELKSLAGEIAAGPKSVPNHLSALEKFAELLETLSPRGRGTLFDLYHDSLRPFAVGDLKLLRRECRDLLTYLGELDERRLNSRGLRIVK